MQKPQQRKYHSSCNRSVHRGTAHGKQRVKVCKRKTPHLLVRSFLSPYGDGTWRYQHTRPTVVFSPPYGDGTQVINFMGALYKFSPPYGDGTTKQQAQKGRKRFSPPYGDSTKEDKMKSAKLRFRPLTGMVLYDYQIKGFFKEFSPPYGDGTFRPTFDPNRR
mgnify:CR=1 FL=1